MKKIAIALLFTLLAGCHTVFAGGIEAVDGPQWQAIDYTSNVSYSIDTSSIVKSEETGIISFFYYKKYREKDVHGGEIVAVEGKMEYDPAKNLYSYRSMNYTRKNKPSYADVLLYMVPEWHELEEHSPEAALCKAAEDAHWK